MGRQTAKPVWTPCAFWRLFSTMRSSCRPVGCSQLYAPSVRGQGKLLQQPSSCSRNLLQGQCPVGRCHCLPAIGLLRSSSFVCRLASYRYEKIKVPYRSEKIRVPLQTSKPGGSRGAGITAAGAGCPARRRRYSKHQDSASVLANNTTPLAKSSSRVLIPLIRHPILPSESDAQKAIEEEYGSPPVHSSHNKGCTNFMSRSCTVRLAE